MCLPLVQMNRFHTMSNLQETFWEPKKLSLTHRPVILMSYCNIVRQNTVPINNMSTLSTLVV